MDDAEIAPVRVPLRRRGPIGRARAQVHRVLGLHLSPRQVFFAVLVGAMVGASPLYGLHLSVCLLLAWLLRLNAAAMYAAANISVPPLLPPLAFACVQTGERLLRGRFLPLHQADFKAALGAGGVHALVTRFFLDWLVGGLVVGAAIGAVLGGLAALLVAQKGRRGTGGRDGAGEAGADRGGAAAALGVGTAAPSLTSSTITAAIEAASGRYRAAPRPLRFYAYFKYRLDPVYRRIAELVPPGTLTVDLGTGLGMLPLLLVLLPGERRALGIEWDAAKLAAGRRAGADLPRLDLVEGDARTVSIPGCEVVTLIDVLHYHPAAEQRELLARAAAALAPGGTLLVREGDRSAGGGGAAWTRWLEAVAVRVGWNRGAGETRFRDRHALARELASLGLVVEVEPLSGRLHPGNVLLRARRQSEAGAAEAGGPASMTPGSAA